MALLEADDFRTAALAEFCAGLDLTDDEASDNVLDAAILRLQNRLDEYCNDKFEEGALTLELDGAGSSRLFLPYRCTAVTSVKVRDEQGVLGAAQDTDTYRLRSSLIESGTRRVGDIDWLEIVGFGDGLLDLSVYYGNNYAWPRALRSVEVVGTFGWTTAPADVKRALALMVYHHFKPLRADLRFATRVTTAEQQTDFALTEPTGIPEVDQVVAEYQRTSQVAVG